MTEAPSDVVLLFSGGYDSTIAAMALAQHHARVHLLTFGTFGVTRLDRAGIHVAELQRALGAGRFVHHTIDVRARHRTLLEGFVRDYDRFFRGSPPASICLSCKLAMHSAAVAYALEHRIATIADGAVRTQADHPEIMPGVVNALRRFDARLGIRYTSPIYERVLTADEKRALLAASGCSVGTPVGQSSRSIQPLCVVGPTFTLWHFLEPYRERDAVAWVEAKLPALEALLAPDVARFGPLGPPLVLGPDDLVPPADLTPASEFGPVLDRLVALLAAPLWGTAKLGLHLAGWLTRRRR